MKISSLKYYTSDAVKSLVRNKTISSASIITLSATLFLLGVFLLTVFNIGQIVDDVEAKVEIKVFLKEDITFAQQRDIETALKTTTGVKTVTYESKSEALNKFREMLSEKDRGLLSGYDGTRNPLPSSFIVKLDSPEMAEGVTLKVKDMSGVYSVGNDQELIDMIIVVSKTIKWIGFTIFAMLIGISLFLIGNTIRLTVFSRRREIGIMKFVGATDWFIRWPFVIEGVIIGLLGGVIANFLLYYAYRYAFIAITESLMLVSLISPSYVINNFFWQFIIAGVAIGSIGSAMSLRKFLNV